MMICLHSVIYMFNESLFNAVDLEIGAVSGLGHVSKLEKFQRNRIE